MYKTRTRHIKEDKTAEIWVFTGYEMRAKQNCIGNLKIIKSKNESTIKAIPNQGLTNVNKIDF
jgi:hypothetical protein